MEGPRSRLGSKDAATKDAREMHAAKTLVEVRYGAKRNASKSVESASPEKAEESEAEIQADADFSELPVKRVTSKSSEQYVKAQPPNSGGKVERQKSVGVVSRMTAAAPPQGTEDSLGASIAMPPTIVSTAGESVQVMNPNASIDSLASKGKLSASTASMAKQKEKTRHVMRSTAASR